MKKKQKTAAFCLAKLLKIISKHMVMIINRLACISLFAISDYDALWVISRQSPEDKLEEANVHLKCGELHCFNKNVFNLSFANCLTFDLGSSCSFMTFVIYKCNDNM